MLGSLNAQNQSHQLEQGLKVSHPDGMTVTHETMALPAPATAPNSVNDALSEEAGESPDAWATSGVNGYTADVTFTSGQGTIEIKARAEVSGAVSADLGTGPGWAQAMAIGRAQASYGNMIAKAEATEGLAVTTPQTPYTIGASATISGHGVSLTTTWYADQPAVVEKPLADLDNKPFQETSDAAITILTKGDASLWPGAGAPGSVEYEVTASVVLTARFKPLPPT